MNTFKPRSIYISGPMTGLPQYNYPAFFEVENILKSKYKFNKNLVILNPARIDDGSEYKFNHSRAYYIRKSIEMLLKATDIYVLKGWQDSEGAKLEIAIAKELKLRFIKEPVDDIYDDDIFELAKKLVTNDRLQQYGHPSKNFKDIGRIWGAILQIDDISASKVALMMAGLKLARESFLPKKDNRVDAVGYLHIADMLDRV
jgi:hypothetical protein